MQLPIQRPNWNTSTNNDDIVCPGEWFGSLNRLACPGSQENQDMQTPVASWGHACPDPGSQNKLCMSWSSGRPGHATCFRIVRPGAISTNGGELGVYMSSSWTPKTCCMSWSSGRPGHATCFGAHSGGMWRTRRRQLQWLQQRMIGSDIGMCIQAALSQDSPYIFQNFTSLLAIDAHLHPHQLL